MGLMNSGTLEISVDMWNRMDISRARQFLLGINSESKLKGDYVWNTLVLY